MSNNQGNRVRNPFHDPLVTELIEDPHRYYKEFSQRILVGETLALFQPVNVVLVGAQGCGKSMILNLIRHQVLSEWIAEFGQPPEPLESVKPFFGISINLVRAHFHAFGRRSVAKAHGLDSPALELDLACASDFLNHYLLQEFLRGTKNLMTSGGEAMREWLGLDLDKPARDSDLASQIASWDCWFGYYSGCQTLDELIQRCDSRISVWRSFLNANIDRIPDEVWETKSVPGMPLHAIGNLLHSISTTENRVPLFVVVDQYEVLPELNLSYGAELQRLVNTLIKARDPVVFYKIGARTYDWGRELRIWGAESRIEIQRDYTMINLSEVLMRGEDPHGWLFPGFAEDVAYRRLVVEGHFEVGKRHMKQMLGPWSAEAESLLYIADEQRRALVIGPVPDSARQRIISLCGNNASPLELRLAGAWTLEQQQMGVPEARTLEKLGDCSWRRNSWRKERVYIALLQIASMANEKKRYYGWDTVVELAGANISAFLLICREIWDMATKWGKDPLNALPLPEPVQTDGIYVASEKWQTRNRIEVEGGGKRYEVLSRLGPAIKNELLQDLAVSNPGHSGFSLPEADLWSEGGPDEMRHRVAAFLQNAVSWAILEERRHTSKQRESSLRRKWYLHPLLSPVFGIPYVRAKEPFYVRVDDVYNWLFTQQKLRFRKRARRQRADEGDVDVRQLGLPFEGGA